MEEELVALVAMTLIFGGPMICYVVQRALAMIENLGRVHLESKLKTLMIERGYSVQEIERICSVPVDATAVQNVMRSDGYPAAVGPQKPIRA